MAIKIDKNEVLPKLDKIKSSIPIAVRRATERTAHTILLLSEKEVPHDEGTLQKSGHTQSVSDGTRVGYNTKYAARLHEHPEYRFKKGRKGEYLADPIKHNMKLLKNEMNKAIINNLFNSR